MGAGRHAGRQTAVTALRWVARVWGTILLLFWGAFFVEHLGWFAHPRALPPPWVFALQGLHLAMLAGLVAAWRWEVAGGLLVVVSAVAFFAFTAGANFVPFAAVTGAPGVLWVVCGWLSGRSAVPSLPQPS
jgi:hypothetical protein